MTCGVSEGEHQQNNSIVVYFHKKHQASLSSSFFHFNQVNVNGPVCRAVQYVHVEFLHPSLLQ